MGIVPIVLEVIRKPIQERRTRRSSLQTNRSRCPTWRDERAVGGNWRDQQDSGCPRMRLPGSLWATRHQGISQMRLPAPMMKNMPRQEKRVIISTPNKTPKAGPSLEPASISPLAVPRRPSGKAGHDHLRVGRIGDGFSDSEHKAEKKDFREGACKASRAGGRGPEEKAAA